jgi:hypothetical protein
MKQNIILILVFLTGSLCSCHNNSNTRNKNYTKLDANKAFVVDTIFNKEISESNKKFRINDSLALLLVLQVKEISEIIDYKYEDSTIFNEIHIDNVPTDSDNNWLINIRQFQTKIDQSTSLMWIFVNANNGSIRIRDIYAVDSIISLETWLKLKTEKQLQPTK